MARLLSKFHVKSLPCFMVLTLGLGQSLWSADSAPSLTDQQVNSPSQPGQTTSSDPEAKLSRWLDINTFSFSARYRSIFDADGVHTYDQGQQRSLLDGKAKLDRDGKYSIGFHFSSGHYFDWAYADFAGGGTTEANQKSAARFASAADRQDAIESGPNASVYPSGGWAFLPRQLYLDAKPVDGLEVQYGSLGFNRGVNTEITSYDEDGYLAGERLVVRKPNQLYFDEVSVTYGYLGDILTPNFFSRYQRLSQANYHQFLLRKKLTPWLEVSTDYTYEVTHTIREAAYLKTKWAKAVDSVRFEAYQRPFDANNVDTDNYASGSGFAITADKTLRKKFVLQAGFASIDSNYDVYAHNGNNSIWAFALNGDQYGMGKRPFVRTTIKLAPSLSLFGFYTHTVGFNYARDGFLWNQTAFNTGMQIDFKPLLHLGKS